MVFENLLAESVSQSLYLLLTFDIMVGRLTRSCDFVIKHAIFQVPWGIRRRYW